MFGQTLLYIALLLVSGFTGAAAWISLCWAQINFRKRLYKAGYTTADLRYQTPGSPATAMIAILLMTCCLIFLIWGQDMIYRIAFALGLGSLIIPIMIYRGLGLNKTHAEKMIMNQHIRFENVFPLRNTTEQIS